MPFHVARLVLALIALGCAPQAGAAQTVRRVVSFNLCADQLVVALADSDQIVGLSPYAADSTLSVVAQIARPYRRLDWQAEATIALKPDLVLVGPNDRSITRRMLLAQGLRVVDVDLISDLDAARRQIRQFAGLLGHPKRGEALIKRLEAARARLDAVPQSSYRTALVVERGGYVQGPSSLVAALLAEAKLKVPNGSPPGYGGFISLEKLLMLKPDLLFLKDPPGLPQDQGALYFTHPALRAVYPPQRRIALPTRLTMCGGPALIAAFDYLADVMAKLN